MINLPAVHLALRNQLLTVTGLPSSRAWQNVDFTPSAGTPYVDESFAPGPGVLRTVNARNGISEKRGLYIVRWYGLQNQDAMTIETGAAAVLAKFSPGTGLAVTGGDVIVISGDPEPWVGAVTPLANGFAYALITIPWRLTTRNVVAA